MYIKFTKHHKKIKMRERPTMNIHSYASMSTDDILHQIYLLNHWLSRYQHMSRNRAELEIRKRNTACSHEFIFQKY